MAKGFRPGIPDGFTFDVAPVADLGDYLDEVRPATPTVQREGDERPPTGIPPVTPTRAVTRLAEVVSQTSRREPPASVKSDVSVPAYTPSPVTPPVTAEPMRVRLPRHLGPRREINMTPETARMSDELLNLIRGGSGQRDTKASEMFHALVLLVHEAKDDLELHAIPKRGRWGSPTARAYPIELKNAFLKSLRRRTNGA